MRKLLSLVLLLPILSLAQVGVNTTAPKAALDVQSSNNGMLIPRVQLTSTLDVTTVVNPNVGPLETSTMVYNMAPAGIAPNDVVAGFYYWNGARWTPIAANALSDHDWHEEGTTTAPDAINDDMFHTGNVAIGKNTADYPLEVNTTGFQFGINNTLINPTTMNVQKATLFNTITDNTDDLKYGVINTVTNNSATSGGVGVRNNVSGDGTLFYGNSNYVTAGVNSNNSDLIGVRNEISNNSNNTSAKGMYNIFNGTGGNLNFISGIENNFRVTAIGKVGLQNVFDANTDGYNSGVINALNTDLPFNTQNGISNTFTTGTLTTGSNIGVNNYFIGAGSGEKTGSSTTITSSGNGQHTGAVQVIEGSGTGNKYGTRTVINSFAGGTHYGIHSTVLKPGANNFAGYFLGNVGIGTTTLNTYTLPASRGTNGQIMQTDGSGNVSWQNPGNSEWTLNGNAGTSAPTAFGNTFSATDNFIGTTDNVDLIFGTNNRPRMKVSGFGNVGIGYDPTSLSKLTVCSPFTIGNNNRNCLNIMQENNDNGGTLIIPASSTFSNLSSGTGLTRWTNVNIYSGRGGSINNGTNIGLNVIAENAANNYAIIVPADSGDVGFGTNNPTTKLHVVKPTAGALRIEDGTQANGNVLRSDANGVGTWQNPNTFSWSLTGNSVNAATQFLGSTNSADVRFRRNNISAGVIGDTNTAFGLNALDGTSGVFNVAIGVNALTNLGLADQNVAVGWNALSNVTIGGNNIGIGTNALVPTATGNNQIRLGNVNIAYAGIQVAWSVTSDSRWKDNIRNTDLGLDFINQLRPVSYTRKNDSSKKTEYGFVAQELDQTLNDFGAAHNGMITKDDQGMLSVRYNDLLAPMVKAIQELKSENDNLKKQNQQLENRLKAIEEKLSR